MTGTVNPESIREALRVVNDPEIGISIVDLGLVYEIEVVPYEPSEDDASGEEGGHAVSVTMTLTTPGCPAGPYILQQVRDRVESVEGVKQARVDLTFNPMWNESMMSEEVRWILGR
jgi:metal-sulfur cluster biosynthetic enzyme